MFNDWIIQFIRIWYLALLSQITACLSFLICKMGVVLVAATWCFYWWEVMSGVEVCRMLKRAPGHRKCSPRLWSSVPSSTDAATQLSVAMTALAWGFVPSPEARVLSIKSQHFWGARWPPIVRSLQRIVQLKFCCIWNLVFGFSFSLWNLGFLIYKMGFGKN